MQPQTEEQRGKRALTARGSISKAMRGLVGGVAAGKAEHRRQWTAALIPQSSWQRFANPTDTERTQAARAAWRGGRCKEARSTPREQGRTKTGVALLPHVKLAPRSAPGPSSERREHLDTTIAFAGARQRRRRLRVLDALTVKWATGDLPEECRFLLDTQLMLLKTGKEPTTKMFDDDEWIRSLTEAETITADIPEGHVTHTNPSDAAHDQGVDPKKV